MRRKLTSKVVEHLTATGEGRLEVWDTLLQSFGVRVSPKGRKVWFVFIRADGRPKRITVGTYPALPLADAREHASEIIRSVQLGIYQRKPEAKTHSLGETIPLFIERYAKPKNKGWNETAQLFQKFKTMFDTPLNEIKRSNVADALDLIMAAGTPYRANRALAAIKKLMSWALDRGMIDINPIAGLKPPHKEQARDRILNDRELSRLLAAADAEGYPFGYLVKLLVFTGQRRGEVTGMRWSEIDFERSTWTIPAARAKNGQVHDVPLSEPVLMLLRQIPRFADSDYVLTTTGITPISGFKRVKHRLDTAIEATNWRIHDLRRTTASGMARLGVTPHVVEKVLNHRTGIISGVAAVYNRYGYENEKRDALAKWARFVTQLVGKDSLIMDEHVKIVSPSSDLSRMPWVKNSQQAP